jgi:hypothetical protein
MGSNPSWYRGFESFRYRGLESFWVPRVRILPVPRVRILSGTEGSYPPGIEGSNPFGGYRELESLRVPGGWNPYGYRRFVFSRHRGFKSLWWVPGVRFLQVPRVRFLQTGLRYLFLSTVIVKSLILFLVLNLHYFYLAKIISAISLAIFCNHSFIR